MKRENGKDEHSIVESRQKHKNTYRVGIRWLKLIIFTKGLILLRFSTFFLPIERVILRGYLSMPATAETEIIYNKKSIKLIIRHTKSVTKLLGRIAFFTGLDNNCLATSESACGQNDNLSTLDTINKTLSDTYQRNQSSQSLHAHGLRRKQSF